MSAESVDTFPTHRAAWRWGQRCLVPAAWYLDSERKAGRTIWRRQRSTGRDPWALAGIWLEWTDRMAGQNVACYSMIASHRSVQSMLDPLHEADPLLPTDQRDFESVVPISPRDWVDWLEGDEAAARKLLTRPSNDGFDSFDLGLAGTALNGRVSECGIAC